jgi:hypothetical protein
MRKIILTTAAIALSASLTPALAHGEEDHGGGGERRVSHSRYHDRLEGAHERAHEDGFESRREHRHRALRYMHREYHGYRPYRWWGRNW